jgi:dipeptidyl-peptidase-3
MAHTAAIERRSREGRTFYVMIDAAEFREGCGRLLAEVQRVKSEGDYAAARRLFDLYGTHFDPALRDEIVRRVSVLNLPSYTAFVQPRLEAITGRDGSIADVRIHYPRDLERQMLEYSGRRAPGATSPRATA